MRCTADAAAAQPTATCARPGGVAVGRVGWHVSDAALGCAHQEAAKLKPAFDDA